MKRKGSFGKFCRRMLKIQARAKPRPNVFKQLDMFRDAGVADFDYDYVTAKMIYVVQEKEDVSLCESRSV